MTAATLVLLAIIFANISSGKSWDIASPLITNWGEWGSVERCPYGTYVYGFQLQTESSQGSGIDDTALNGITLFCISNHVKRPSSRYTTIRSSVGPWGNQGQVFECPYPHFAVGFELRSERPQGLRIDDTAANNFKIRCSNNQNIQGVSESWGDWTGLQICPGQRVLCGIQTQVERMDKGELCRGGDDTALNNIRMDCCDMQ